MTKYLELLWSLVQMTPYLIQVWFYFENHSFLLQKVQPLLFIEQLYQLPQPHIEKRTLIITNRIWRTNGLNNWCIHNGRTIFDEKMIENLQGQKGQPNRKNLDFLGVKIWPKFRWQRQLQITNICFVKSKLIKH